MLDQVLILSCTPRSNFELAKKLEEQADALNLKSEIVELESMNLPLYTPDEESHGGVPEAISTLAQKMIMAPGFIFVCPEYNGGMTPVAVNVINWLSRSGGDWRKCFSEKMVVMATASGGGGQNLLKVMNTQFQHLGAVVAPRPIIVNSGKVFSEAAAQAALKLLIRWSKKT